MGLMVGAKWFWTLGTSRLPTAPGVWLGRGTDSKVMFNTHPIPGKTKAP